MKDNNRAKIIAIVGPTASGKTEAAIRLAKKFKGELVSIDSRQIYKGMDIGTAKEISYPQHLIDILTPKTSFNVLRFKNLCLRAIRKILKNNKLPILVGGSGLYFNAVVYNLKIPRVKADKKLRKELEKLSVPKLQEKLKKLDPAAAQLTGKNKRRIIRALEVIIKTGSYFSAQKKRGKPLFDALIIGLRMPRKNLYERINKRVDEQIKMGLVEEVKKLVEKYGDRAYALQNTIAYKELLPYLKNETTLEKATEEIKKNSRRFARRQMTWFRAQPDIQWVDSYKEAENLVKNFLS
jgi:tRNA dimethylallyltransferase